MNSKFERRLIKAEFRMVKNGSKPTRLVGYAAVFNTDSEDLGGFTEQIAPGAFSDVLAAGPDTRCLLNHDPNLLLGRTKSGTLTLSIDSKGLLYDCSVPDTSAGRDVMVLADRGDLSQSSFGFRVSSDPGSEKWYDASGREVALWSGVRRVIFKVGELMDCSVVTYPAYPASSVEARSNFLFPDGAPLRRAATQSSEASNATWIRDTRARLEKMKNDDIRDRINAAWLENFRSWVAASLRD